MNIELVKEGKLNNFEIRTKQRTKQKKDWNCWISLNHATANNLNFIILNVLFTLDIIYCQLGVVKIKEKKSFS